MRRTDQGAVVIRIVAQTGIAEPEFSQEIVGVEVGEVFGDRGVALLPVRIVVDRRRAVVTWVGKVGKLLQRLAVVMVQRIGDRAIGSRQVIQQQAAEVEVIGIGVPDREGRDDRPDRRMAGGGKEVRRSADIGYAGRADRAVRPGLRHQPVRELAVILALPRRAKSITRPGGSAGAAHVGDHHRVAVWHEIVANIPGVRAGLDLRRCRRRDLETAVIGRVDQQGRKRFARRQIFWQMYVKGDADTVAHGHVAGTEGDIRTEAWRIIRGVAFGRDRPGVGVL